MADDPAEQVSTRAGLGYDATAVADDVVIREATAADLPDVGRIWRESASGDDADAVDAGTSPFTAVPSLYAHELAQHELFVLELDRMVVAFASVITRSEIAFLADLFVSEAYQSRRLGQRLLQHVLPPEPQTCCTVSSNDPRALPLYVRFGMLPMWPQVQLVADLADLRLGEQADITAIEANPEDPDLARWDEQLSVRHRPQDIAYWVRDRGGVPLWFVRGGVTVGYGVAQTLSDDLLQNPETITLGPIGAGSANDATDCVLAAVRWARERGNLARISFTGPHPALPVLLEAGFRISERETFCFRGNEPFIDPRRYVSSGGDLF